VNHNAKLAAVLAKQGNGVCADCTSTTLKWAVQNLGTFICTKCSGVHRSLGTSISFVQSLTLDDWKDDASAAMRGNVAANAELEYQVPATVLKPHASGTMDARKAYITAKYKQRAFVKKDDAKPLAPKIGEACTAEALAAEESKAGMAETAGIVILTLKSGKGLKDMDYVGKSDPQVWFDDGKHVLKSKALKDTCDPDCTSVFMGRRRRRGRKGEM
jgi:hypothetical protein